MPFISPGALPATSFGSRAIPDADPRSPRSASFRRKPLALPQSPPTAAHRCRRDLTGRSLRPTRSLCINMVHISPWAATLGLLLAGAVCTLPAGAPLILYGPYLRAEVSTAPSKSLLTPTSAPAMQGGVCAIWQMSLRSAREAGLALREVGG